MILIGDKEIYGTGRVMHTNEYNFLPTSYSSNNVCFNYRSIESQPTAAEVTEFRFNNGLQNSGVAKLIASGYDKPDGYTLYLGSSGNDNWVSVQDICCNAASVGDSIWSIRTNGYGVFQRLASVNGFFKESDIRLKSDIKPLTHSLDQICSIPTDSFIKGGIRQIGTIAQDVEKLIPEIVVEKDVLASTVPNKEDFEVFTKEDKGVVDEYVKVKEVEYSMLGVVAVEGIKLLKQEIEDLKKQVEELKNGMCNSGNDIQ